MPGKQHVKIGGAVLRTRTFAFIVALVGGLPSNGQPQSQQPYTLGERAAISSRVLGEDRQLLIASPANYSTSNQRYAVLYVLDGAENFAHIASLVDFLTGNEFIPPMLVVAVANTDRSRDFLTPPTNDDDRRLAPTAGGADNFVRFLDTELIPWVAERYRTNGYQMLFGHSFGGFFCLYGLLQHPTVFDACIAASPSVFWNNEELSKYAVSIGDDHIGKSLYMSLGYEGADAMAQIGRLVAALGKSNAGLRWHFEHMEEQTHRSTPHRTVYGGLEFVFDGWYVKNALAMFDEIGIQGIHDHYRRLDRDFGYDRRTPPTVMRQLGFRLFEANRLDDLGAVMRYDPIRYPVHPRESNLLAQAFRNGGETDKAIEFFTMTLRASPSNEEAMRSLAELGIDVGQLLDGFAIGADELKAISGRYRMPNGSVFVFRAVGRGLVLEMGGMTHEIIMQSPTTYTFGPSQLYFDFKVDLDAGRTTMRVRTPTTEWEPTERLD